MTTELLGDPQPPDEPDHGGGPAHAEYERIGPYRVLAQLGEGGMGVVHLALDRRGKAVAVKVLREHVAHDAEARKRLSREVETLSRVRSSRIAPILDADLNAAQPYVVTRYVPGPSLDQQVKENGPLSPEEMLRVGRGLAEAIREVHATGVIHRDLKPGNVLLLDGEPILIDFGIAHVAEASRMTMTGLVMGTPGYLSPEIVEGGDVTAATDWWGWAATLAFAATGRAPFGAGGMEAVLARVCRGDADLRGVDPNLAPLLYAALSPTSDQRPDAGEVIGALERYAAGRPVTEVLPSRARVAPTRQAPAFASQQHPPAPRPVAPTAHQPTPAQLPSHPSNYPPQPYPQQVPSRQVAPVARQVAPPQYLPEGPREVDPRIGKPMRTPVLAAALACATAVATVAPFVVLIIALIWGVAARTADRTVTGTVLRRHTKGRRSSDGAMAAASVPGHFLVSTVTTVIGSLFPLLVAVSAVVATAVALAFGGSGAVRLEGPIPLAVGAFVGSLMAWWGPSSQSLRRGSRSLVRGVTPNDSVAWGVAAFLIVVACVAAFQAFAGDGSPSWWPLTSSPLPDSARIPVR